MRRGQARVRNVLAVVESLRERHPELRRPLTWPALVQIFRREKIKLLMLPLVGGVPADVVGVAPYFVITLNSEMSQRRHTRDAAHEWGHTKLHPGEVGEIERNLSPIKSSDPRELEAQLFAQLLVVGPEATPEHPKISPIVAALIAREAPKPPTQLPLPLPTAPPVYKPPVERYPSRRDRRPASYLDRPDHLRHPRYRGPRIRVGDSHDSLLFDWSKEGKPLGFFAGNRGWCDIWDTMPSTRPGRARDILVCGDRRATWRDFVWSTTERYRYVFREGQKRSRAPRDLLTQIERSVRVTLTAPMPAAVLFRARKPEPETDA